MHGGGDISSHKEALPAGTGDSTDVPLAKIQLLGTAWGPGMGYTASSCCAESSRYVLIQPFPAGQLLGIRSLPTTGQVPQAR